MKSQKHEEKCSCGHDHDKTVPAQRGHEEDKQRQKEMLEFNILEMQLRQLEQQAMMAEQQIVEQQNLISSLDELKNVKKGRDILFPFSKDIFVKGKIESSDVLVNVGSKTLTRKSIDEAKKFVDNQMKRLLEANEEIRAEMEKIMRRIQMLEQRLNH